MACTCASLALPSASLNIVNSMLSPTCLGAQPHMPLQDGQLIAGECLIPGRSSSRGGGGLLLLLRHRRLALVHLRGEQAGLPPA